MSAPGSLAAMLRAYRRECKLSQEALAIKAGVTLSTLSRLECGLHTPSWETIHAIARALDMTATEVNALIEADNNESLGRASVGRRGTPGQSGVLEPATARVVFACVPQPPEAPADAQTIARQAEIAVGFARRYLRALVIAGDVLRAPGQRARYYLSEQGEQRAHQEDRQEQTTTSDERALPAPASGDDA